MTEHTTNELREKVRDQLVLASMSAALKKWNVEETTDAILELIEQERKEAVEETKNSLERLGGKFHSLYLNSGDGPDGKTVYFWSLWLKRDDPQKAYRILEGTNLESLIKEAESEEAKGNH